MPVYIAVIFVFEHDEVPRPAYYEQGTYWILDGEERRYDSLEEARTALNQISRKNALYYFMTNPWSDEIVRRGGIMGHVYQEYDPMIMDFLADNIL